MDCKEFEEGFTKKSEKFLLTFHPARKTQRESMSKRAAQLSFGVCQDGNILVQRDGSGDQML